MTGRRRAFVIGGAALAAAGASGVALWLVFRPGDAEYHNACIDRAMASVAEIEIRQKALMPGQAPTLRSWLNSLDSYEQSLES